jgi:hypothetical protein
MSRIVTIAGRFVESSAGLIATLWAPAIGIIFLLRWIFDVLVPVGAPPDRAAQRLVPRCVRVDQAAADQTPVVHSVSLLTHTEPVCTLAAPAGLHLAGETSHRSASAAPGDSGDGGPDNSDAIVFERELGDRLFHDPGAVAAARRTAERLFDAMRLLHTELYPGTTPGRTERIFFSDKLTNPGQVGRDVVTLRELLREGNLRMVMTSLLNATHDSKDPMTVEMTIQELLNRPDWEEVADRAGLDVPRLRALKELVDAGHGVFAVPALGSHSPDARDAVTECIASQAARWQRTLADRNAYRWTAREFADRGIALHPLEVAAQRHAESAQQIDSRRQAAKSAAASQPGDDPDAVLHWLSGRALFAMDTEAPWFQAVSVERGFPVTTGISGCAARLHSVFIWIRPDGVAEHEFTRALIGWILPSDHHSLYEVIRGIQVASPHLFHARGDRFAQVSDLYRRAPWACSDGEGEHGEAAPAPGAGVGGGQLRCRLAGHRWARRSTRFAAWLNCSGVGGEGLQDRVGEGVSYAEAHCGDGPDHAEGGHDERADNQHC